MNPYQKYVVTVSELNRVTKMLFDTNELFGDLYIKGEISNFVNHRTGHFYFSLKDETACVKAVMFKSNAIKLPFMPENGMKVIVHGRVSVFERDGVYQVYADDIQPDGLGSLYYAYEQLRRKLEAEGLFDPGHKKPLPALPTRVGIITSPTGAAIQDMKHIMARRFPLCDILLYPALVQGEGAAEDLMAGVRYFNETQSVDVIIIGRGGGSLEDLWAFNNEALARTLYESRLPVISAVGHESDFTICDFVADVRASTPSAAAELVVPERTEIKGRLRQAEDRLSLLLQASLSAKRTRLSYLASSHALLSPLQYLETKRLTVAASFDALDSAVKAVMQKKTIRYRENAARLGGLNPLAVLARGYGVVYDTNGRVVSSAGQVKVGDTISSRLSDGVVKSTVTQVCPIEKE